MSETLAGFFVELFDGKISSELIVFIISLFPVLELRGGLVAAKLLDVELVKAFIICYIGNMLPIPFILLFIRKIFQFLKRFEKIGKLIEKLEVRSLRKGDKVRKYSAWGLLLFVAVPLPGTGGWTGALNSDIKQIRNKSTCPSAGTRQRNCNKQKQTPCAVFAHLVTLPE